MTASSKHETDRRLIQALSLYIPPLTAKFYKCLLLSRTNAYPMTPTMMKHRVDRPQGQRDIQPSYLSRGVGVPQHWHDEKTEPLQSLGQERKKYEASGSFTV